MRKRRRVPTVITPRLTFRGVVRNGALHGVALTAVLIVVVLLLDTEDQRASVLAGAMVGAGLLGAINLVVGLLYSAISLDDLRRWRDHRTVSGTSGAVTIVGPAMLRLGVTALVVGLLSAVGLTVVVEL